MLILDGYINGIPLQDQCSVVTILVFRKGDVFYICLHLGSDHYVRSMYTSTSIHMSIHTYITYPCTKHEGKTRFTEYEVI